jgi:SAM-dependent methyltransferase
MAAAGMTRNPDVAWASDAVTYGPDRRIYAGGVPVDQQRSEAFGDDPERYPITFLDVGCGTGIASRLFQGGGRDVLGIEPDPRKAAVGRRAAVKVEQAVSRTGIPKGGVSTPSDSAYAWHWVQSTV